MTDEPSTHRMRADEVRALIRRLEPLPPPRAVGDLAAVDADATREREPPTLLYRRGSRAPVPPDEPRTMRGMGSFTAHESTARPLSFVDGRPASAHEGGVAPELDAARSAAPARVPASERVRLARRRSLVLGCVIVALLAVAPVSMAVVRRATGPSAPARVDDGVCSVPSLSRAPGVTGALDPATHLRVDPVRRATELLMEGDSAGALSAFRTLSRAHPEHFALGHVVRSLEQRMRDCAGDADACR